MHIGNAYRRKKPCCILFLTFDYKNIGERVTIKCPYKAGHTFLSQKPVQKNGMGRVGVVMQ